MAVLKKEFTDRMAEIGGITKKEARRGCELFLETLLDYMAKDKKVMLKGFGRFEMKTYKERKGRNPGNGDECVIPEHKKMRLYASDTLGNKIKDMQEGSYERN